MKERGIDLKLKRLLAAGLLILAVASISACGQKDKQSTESKVSIGAEENNKATPSDAKETGETYIDESGKKISKAGEDEGPGAKQGNSPYETVGDILQQNIDEEQILRDSMETSSEKERTAPEGVEETDEQKQEKYEFNGSSIKLDVETLPGQIQLYDPMINESTFLDVVRFGEVAFQLSRDVNEIGYTTDVSGNIGHIVMNNGSKVTVLQLHEGNVGTDKFTNSVQVSTIQKYTGMSLSGATIIEGVEVNRDTEILNTYIPGNMTDAVCIAKTINGIYIVRWQGTTFGDSDILRGMVSLIL